MRVGAAWPLCSKISGAGRLDGGGPGSIRRTRQRSSSLLAQLHGAPQAGFTGTSRTVSRFASRSNKARRAGLMFDAIHSVDRERLVPRLAEAAAERDRPLELYVQIDYVRTDEPEAVVEERAHELCRAIDAVDGLNLAGPTIIACTDIESSVARNFVAIHRDVVQDRYLTDRRRYTT